MEHSPLMLLILSSSVSCDAAYGEGQATVDGEEHWTQRSASQAVKDPHQSSQAGWCMCHDEPLVLILFEEFFFFDNLITVYCLMYIHTHHPESSKETH